MSYACRRKKYSSNFAFKIYIDLRQSVDANLVIWSPYEKFSGKKKSYLLLYGLPSSLTYWIVGNFFQVLFGFVIISTIEIICMKYFQLRKIANRTKCNTFFDIQSDVM